MQRIPVITLSLLGSVLITGCPVKPVKVQTGFDRHVDFGRLHGWDWTPAGGALETPAAAKTADRIQLDGLAKGHIERRLAQKGYRHDSAKPDFRVAWSFGEWQLDRHQQPNGGYGAVGLAFPGLHGSLVPANPDGRAEPPSLDPYTSQYEQARLELIVTDARTASIIWNASATDDTDFGYFTAHQRDRIGAAVDRLLDGFPPLNPGTP